MCEVVGIYFTFQISSAQMVINHFVDGEAVVDPKMLAAR